MEYVSIQAQDLDGVWRTYRNIENNSQRISSEMSDLQRQFPNFRIRAVDYNGRIVDIL
jgi:hypothetical protein